MNTLLRFKEILLLLAIMGLATLATQGLYLQPQNLTNILRNIAPEAIMAMGMTLVILTAGIDLSVGSILALASVACAAMVKFPAADLAVAAVVPLALLATATVGGLCGALQGGLIARLDIQPFIITLAGMIGFRGLARLLTDNRKVQLGATNEFAEFVASKPVMIGLLVLSIVLTIAILRLTVLGRQIRAVGDNERAAHYAGLPVRRVKLAVYTYCGMLAGIAGMLQCARNTVGDANFGVMDELEAIAMVVIGGTTLAGGKGSVLGTVLGVLILGTVNNVLGLKNVDANVQSVLLAAIIVLAVAVQRTRKHI